MSKDQEDAVRDATRKLIGAIWRKSQAGIQLEGDEAVLAKVMQEHPEYREVWEQAEEYGGEIISADEVNPFLHVQMHATVENQISGRNPAEVREIVKALMRKGHSRHEAIHAVANVLATEIYYILRDRRPFNESRYLGKLRKLI